MNMSSVKDLAAEAERAGYEVDEVDLPANVGGFALWIEGKPHIVVNRAKSTEYRQYTVAHELAHHMLHLAPSPLNPGGFPISNKDMMEFQANAFASSLAILTPETEREAMLRQNPELVGALVMPIFLSIATVVVAVVMHLCSNPVLPVSADRR